MAGKPIDVFGRIAAKTDSSGGPSACWTWHGGKWPKGTPLTTIQKRSYSVRRLLWERDHGPMPEGRTASPACANKECVNPHHLVLIMFRSDMEERFWSHVDKSAGPDACWPWKDAASFRRGYGMFRIGWKKPIVQASRHSYEITHGVTLATEQFVMHTCDNPPCCNPAHLQLGDAQANNADMWAKGRGSRGPAHAKACAAGRKKTGTDLT
jgi:hypothetical protein